VMNLRKQIAGFALFSVIVGSAVLINALLSAPIAAVSHAPITKAISYPPLKTSQPINYRVWQVSLDFQDQKSYTELKLTRLPNQPAPPKVWVTTVFFNTDRTPSKVWRSTVAIPEPFAKGDELEYVATGSFELSKYFYASGAKTFFARVYVSTTYPDGFSPSDLEVSPDLKTAAPVVVRWPMQWRGPTGTDAYRPIGIYKEYPEG